MKIQIASDIHLGFKDNREYVKNHPLKPVGEILLLGGDIMPLFKVKRYEDFLLYCSDHFEKTYWIPGNHEFYNGDISGKEGEFYEEILPNVILLNNSVVKTGDVNLIFSTLWTPIPEEYFYVVKAMVSDYRLIYWKEKLFTPRDSGLLFHQNFLFIDRVLKESQAEKNIVMTHHVPTFQHYPEEYKGSPINSAFAVDLDDFIADSGADIWIYGHHHRNVPQFFIGKTAMLTNQLGYVGKNEHLGFRNDFVLNV